MDQPLPIRRRQRLSCLLITILGLLLSCSTSTCQQTDFSTTLRYTKTIDSRTPTTDSVTETTTNRLYKYNSSLNKLTENSTEPNYLIDKYLKNQGMFWESGVSFVKLLSLVNRECLMKSSSSLECAKKMVVKYMQDILYSPDSYKSEDSNNEVNPNESLSVNNFKKEKNVTALQELVLRRLSDFRVNVNLLQIKDRVKESARAGLSWFKPEGKSSFLTGFGLGFLAFGLKKLLLPIFIGAQIVKSVLIAMFLPSILGGLGKLVGKGVTTFASASGSSGPSNNNVDDFEFKDNVGVDPADPSTAESKYSYMFQYPESGGYGYQNGLPAGTLPAAALYVPGTAAGAASNRYQPLANSKVSYASLPTGAQHHYGSYYTRHQQTNKKQDYKVFHNIPSSSLLLTNYDPFYSPLLSRLDSVFKQLGYESENCRERLVCAMYNNPAKFAPYSNLVSAQLSRELNELRKPSTDNPEILRFFRYMKAAKDGQDGQDCIRAYPGCIASSGTSNANPPMVKTYQDINKLVQARRLSRSMTIEDKRPSSIHSSTA